MDNRVVQTVRQEQNTFSIADTGRKTVRDCDTNYVPEHVRDLCPTGTSRDRHSEHYYHVEWLIDQLLFPYQTKKH